MLVLAIIVAGLVIALSWAAAQRSDVEDVPPANKKPSDDDIEQSNELELSRSMSIGHTHEIVRETDRAKLTEPLPRQNHIQYLDHFHIRLMLDQAENERAEKARSSKSILEHLFGTAKGSLEAVDKTPPLDLYRSRELSRDLSSERSRNDDLSMSL